MQSSTRPERVLTLTVGRPAVLVSAKTRRKTSSPEAERAHTLGTWGRDQSASARRGPCSVATNVAPAMQWAPSPSARPPTDSAIRWPPADVAKESCVFWSSRSDQPSGPEYLARYQSDSTTRRALIESRTESLSA